MEKKNITVTVSGATGSGKSRIAFLLKKFLREQGFEVEYEPNLDHPSEGLFDLHMNQNLNEVVENFKTTRKIKIKELQTPYENIR